MSTLKKGDKVTLTEKVARGMKMTRGVDWITRRGVVIRRSPFTNSVAIQWEDRVSADDWPTEALAKLS